MILPVLQTFKLLRMTDCFEYGYECAWICARNGPKRDAETSWAETKTLNSYFVSTVTLFTPQPNQSQEHPQILINGTIVPLEE